MLFFGRQLELRDSPRWGQPELRFYPSGRAGSVRRGEEVSRDLASRHHVVDADLVVEPWASVITHSFSCSLRPVSKIEPDAARGVAGLVLERDGQRSLLAFDPDDAGIAVEIDRIGRAAGGTASIRWDISRPS